MKRHMIRNIFAVLGALTLVAVLAGCGGSKPVLGLENGENGSVTANANNCKSDGLVVSSIEVPEGMGHLSVTSENLEGVLHIGIGAPLDASEDAELEELTISTEEFLIMTDAMGTSEAIFEIEPGFYSLTVYGDDAEPATGSVVIAPME